MSGSSSTMRTSRRSVGLTSPSYTGKAPESRRSRVRRLVLHFSRPQSVRVLSRAGGYAHALSMAESSCSYVKGLAITSNTPSSPAGSGMALSTTTGSPVNSSSCPTSCRNCQPFITGIIRSSRTTSGRPRRRILKRASEPFSATSTAYPSAPSASCNDSRMEKSSSTTSTLQSSERMSFHPGSSGNRGRTGEDRHAGCFLQLTSVHRLEDGQPIPPLLQPVSERPGSDAEDEGRLQQGLHDRTARSEFFQNLRDVGELRSESLANRRGHRPELSPDVDGVSHAAPVTQPARLASTRPRRRWKDGGPCRIRTRGLRIPGQRPQARPSAGDEDSQADVRPVDGAPVQHLGLTGVIFFNSSKKMTPVSASPASRPHRGHLLRRVARPDRRRTERRRPARGAEGGGDPVNGPLY